MSYHRAQMESLNGALNPGKSWLGLPATRKDQSYNVSMKVLSYLRATEASILIGIVLMSAMPTDTFSQTKPGVPRPAIPPQQITPPMQTTPLPPPPLPAPPIPPVQSAPSLPRTPPTAV